jgi:hypothetical protein
MKDHRLKSKLRHQARCSFFQFSGVSVDNKIFFDFDRFG